MSLRAFHIIFLISTLLLTLYLSYWNYMNWKFFGEISSLFYMLLSLFSGLIIVFYGMKFYNKTKELNV